MKLFGLSIGITLGTGCRSYIAAMGIKKQKKWIASDPNDTRITMFSSTGVHYTLTSSEANGAKVDTYYEGPTVE